MVYERILQQHRFVQLAHPDRKFQDSIGKSYTDTHTYSDADTDTDTDTYAYSYAYSYSYSDTYTHTGSEFLTRDQPRISDYQQPQRWNSVLYCHNYANQWIQLAGKLVD